MKKRVEKRRAKMVKEMPVNLKRAQGQTLEESQLKMEVDLKDHRTDPQEEIWVLEAHLTQNNKMIRKIIMMKVITKALLKKTGKVALIKETRKVVLQGKAVKKLTLPKLIRNLKKEKQ